MKRLFLALALIFFYKISFSQLTAEQRIQDSVIGWWNKNEFDDEFKSPPDAIGKKKEAHINNMVQWMKKSYTPVGGLGTVTRYLQKNTYGVLFMVWNVSHDKLWTDAKGNFKPIPEENTKFYIYANRLFGSYPVSFINKPGELYVFTWPPDGYDHESSNHSSRPHGIHPNVSKYITIRNEVQSIILAPGNKLPIQPVTRGEYLQLADDALATQFIKANEYDKKAIERIRKNIAQLKEKHKASLQDAAIIKDMQPSMYSFDGFDPFDISEILTKRKQYYPVYKLTADVIEKCKTAEPQWVSIVLPYKTKADGNQLHEMYTAVTENINYDYIYNYFFDPEKIKGIAYKPANEEQLNARLAAYRNKNKANITATTTKSLPASVHFMDDFSSGVNGQAPVNWFFNTYSKRCYITDIKGGDGKWVTLGYNTAFSPSLLKKPLPQNFTLEFDMATDGDYTSRTGGAVRLVLNSRKATDAGNEVESGNGARVEINIISGNEADYNNNNYRGEIRTKITAMPSANTESNNSEGIHNVKSLREFTNKQTKVHVAVKVKNNNLSIFINNKEFTASSGFKLQYGGDCKVCGLPAGTTFNSIFFTNTTNNADAIKVYISNVKITKE
jgi:hypothetical protein